MYKVKVRGYVFDEQLSESGHGSEGVGVQAEQLADVSQLEPLDAAPVGRRQRQVQDGEVLQPQRRRPRRQSQAPGGGERAADQRQFGRHSLLDARRVLGLPRRIYFSILKKNNNILVWNFPSCFTVIPTLIGFCCNAIKSYQV